MEKNSYSTLQVLIKFTVEESERVDLLRAEIDKFAKESISSFIVKGITDESWASYEKTLSDAGLRRGEALFLNVDRDVDFEKRTITVNGAVSFGNGNQPMESDGKTENARRTIPLVRPLADALCGHHGLLCTKKDGTMMPQGYKRDEVFL